MEGLFNPFRTVKLWLVMVDIDFFTKLALYRKEWNHVNYGKSQWENCKFNLSTLLKNVFYGIVLFLLGLHFP